MVMKRHLEVQLSAKGGLKVFDGLGMKFDDFVTGKANHMVMDQFFILRKYQINFENVSHRMALQ